MPNRQILDNELVAFETIHKLKKSQEGEIGCDGTYIEHEQSL